jgi:hypothetical protein
VSESQKTKIWQVKSCERIVDIVTFGLELKTRRYLAVKLFKTVWDIMGLHEQNRVLAINTKVLLYTE